jgi:Transmembrane protein 65
VLTRLRSTFQWNHTSGRCDSIVLVQIMAGDYIDYWLGSALMLSTMAAAGLGNMVSDVAGIYCADVVEARARVFKYGRQPSLSAIQRRLPAVVGAH